MVRIFMLFLTLVFLSGCVVITGGAWQTDSELDKYREQGCVEVVSADGRYSGLAEIPTANEWQNLVLTNIGIRISLPVGIQAHNSIDRASVGLYKVHGHYRDSRTAVDIEVRKISAERRKEDTIMFEDLIKNSWGESSQKSVDTRWDQLQAHPQTECREGLYRRDVECPDGSLLYIRGSGEGLIVKATGEELYPGMEAVIRRIMNSIEPVSVKLAP